jgi:hypothetical protein
LRCRVDNAGQAQRTGRHSRDERGFATGRDRIACRTPLPMLRAQSYRAFALVTTILIECGLEVLQSLFCMRCH